MKLMSTGVCGALATHQALDMGKPGAYMTRFLWVPEEPTVHVCGGWGRNTVAPFKMNTKKAGQLFLALKN